MLNLFVWQKKQAAVIVVEDDMNDIKNPYPNGPRKGQFHVICTRMDEKRPRENGEGCRYVAAWKRAQSQTIIFTKKNLV